GLLNQWRQTGAGAGAQGLAVIAGGNLGLAEHAHGPVRRLLGRAPGAAQRGAVAVRVDNALRVAGRAAVQQVVAGLHQVAGHTDRWLAAAAGWLSAAPAHALVAAGGFGGADRAGRVLALLQVRLHGLALGQGAPGALVDGFGHLPRHGLAGQLRAVVVDAALHHAVAE